MKKESFYDSDISTSNPYSILPSDTSSLTVQNLSTCETNTGVSSASRSMTRKHSGTYSWKASSSVNPAISYTFSSLDISFFYNKGYLRFYLYCPSIANKGHTATVELTSSGTCDDEEITFNINSQIKTVGWNEIRIPLSLLHQGSVSEFNPNSCNYFRLFTLGSNCYFYLDHIMITK